jgi:DNA-directed RNA polymerase alpha subunit
LKSLPPLKITDGSKSSRSIQGTDIRLEMRCAAFCSLPSLKISLSKRGAGVVRAADIDAPSNVEIVNPNHYICTIDRDDAAIDMEMTVERGRGYLPADQRDALPIGEIPIDAIFTPVPKVNYVVEHIRVGQAISTAC